MDAALNTQLYAQAHAARWWVALSGGVDSVVLLDLLHTWLQQHEGPVLTAVHVHHGLQVQADSWVEHCQQHCDRYDIPLQVHHVAITDAASLGIEAAARSARLGVFESILGANEVLFQAHHLNDQAETLLLRLLRGAGPQGLSGIPAERSLGRGRICRPLLNYPKQTLEAWALAKGLRWITDPSNSDTRFDRNYLRQQVMPLLAARWPGYLQTFARAAALQSDSAKFLAQTALPQCTSIFGDPGMRLLTETGEAASAVQLNQALHAWLTRSGVPVPSRARLQEFSRQLRSAAPDRQPELRVGDTVLRRWRGAVYRLPPHLQATPLISPSFLSSSMEVMVNADMSRPICLPGQRMTEAVTRPMSECDVEPITEHGRDSNLSGIAHADLGTALKSMPASLTVAQDVAGDWCEVRWRVSANSRLQRGAQLTLRPPVAGERFALPGCRHKSFKQLCQEAGVPPWWRERLAVACLEHLPVAILGLGLLTDGACDGVNVTNLGYEPIYIPFVASNSIE